MPGKADWREPIVEEAVIDPGFSCEPAPGSVGEFKIILGHRSDMEGAWFEPINYFPQLYEKIEWGVKLPDEVEAAIDNWIWNDQHPTEPPLSPALNPFDPEQIDLQAIVDYTTEDGVYFSQPVFGFFYQPFSRNTVYNNPHNENLDDPDNWYWDELTTPYRFRFRWSSTVISHHSVRIKLDVPSMGHWEMEPFEFDSYWGDPRNSFVSVTENGHYFKTDDGHVYFPVGLNINEATFGCNCKEVGLDSDICSECYDDPLNDPCCGISIDKQKRHSMPGTTLKERCIAAAGYVKLEWILEQLKAAGGNSFRTINDPINFDIEFEKLNNYYDRQYQAWEFDQMLNKCNELDLRVEWNHLIHYSVGHHWFGGDNWDWDDKEYNSLTAVRPNDSGYAYWNGCPGDLLPVDFLSTTCAKENYQKKLRYMIARWGYSKNIFVMELMSEINNIGAGQFNGIDMPKPYDVQPESVRPAVAAWHDEMARFIKEDLHHTRHLIAADYTGTAPMEGYPDNLNPCQSNYFDFSWHSQFVDVIAWNNYNHGLNRWEKMADHEYKKDIYQTPGLMCGWDNPEDENDNSGWHSPLGGYSSIWKPVIYPERDMDACLDDDVTGFIKDALVGPFSGHASSGMSWDEWHSVDEWNILGEVLEYLELNVLNDVDLGTEEWQPDHSYSTSTGLLSPNDVLAEAVYLRKEGEGAAKYTGIILNRTWNPVTSGGAPCSSPEILTDYTDNNLNIVTEFGSSSHKIKVSGAGVHQYTIRYFHPFTKIKLEEVDVWSITGMLTLDNYPIMGSGNDDHQPFYFFEAFKKGSEFDESPIVSDPYSEDSDLKEKPSTVTTAQITNSNNYARNNTLNTKFKIHPNPGNDWTDLYCGKQAIGHYLFIYSSNGMELGKMMINSEIVNIDFTQFHSGLYFVVCPDLSLSSTYIKLNE